RRRRRSRRLGHGSCRPNGGRRGGHEAALDLELAELQLGFEAKVERPVLAEGAAGEAAGGRTEQEREVLRTPGDDAVVQEERNRAEEEPGDAARHRPGAADRPRLREQVLRVLLDDAL